MDTESRSAFDVVVIGGSYAGLSASMQLARARRRIMVVDAGSRRNRFAATSHGFLGQDGRSPDAIAAEGRRQLLAYPSVRWLDGEAAHAEPAQDGFLVRLKSGDDVRTRLLILATGVVDELPDVPGLAERWGRHVFHCPYCHGYELDQGRIGVLAVSPMSLHQAMMLPDWGTVTLFTNEAVELDDAQRRTLAARGVAIEPTRVTAIVDAATVQLVDGRRVVLDGLFTASRVRMASPIAERLGCVLDEGPIGTYIRTDDFKETSVKGVFACGDAARMAGNVAFAVGDGAQAGVGAHKTLLFG
ncbi:MAG: NAD(P)/FAD-dependent oxidoreductase [Burkholderiaceae bacterium]